MKNNRNPSKREYESYKDAARAVSIWLMGGVEKAKQVYAWPGKESERLGEHFDFDSMWSILPAEAVAVNIIDGLTPLEKHCMTMNLFHEILGGWDGNGNLTQLIAYSPYESLLARSLDFCFAFEKADMLLTDNWAKVKALATELYTNGTITPRRYAEIFNSWGKAPKFDSKKYSHRLKPYEGLWERAMEIEAKLEEENEEEEV